MNGAQLIYRGKLRLSFNIPFLSGSARAFTRDSTRGLPVSSCVSLCVSLHVL